MISQGELYRQMAEDDLVALNNRNNVIERVDNLRGWHIGSCELWKPGVYKITITRHKGMGMEMINGFCSQDVLRLAIEQKIVSKPDGYITPPR